MEELRVFDFNEEGYICNDEIIDKVNEIVRYINKNEEIVAEEDESKATPDWEQMYKDLCIDYRQVCKEKAELKENYDKVTRELTIDEYALNDACILFKDTFNRSTDYILKLAEELKHDGRSWLKIKEELKANSQDQLKKNGMID